MKSRMIILTVGLTAVLLATFLAFATTVMTEGEFGRILFDRLRLVRPGTVLSVDERISALEDLGYAPLGGYHPREPLTMGALAVILVRVYGFENRLPTRFTPTEAIELLVELGIFEGAVPATDPVPWSFGEKMIYLLPEYPGPHDTDVPLFVLEPPLSDIE